MTASGFAAKTPTKKSRDSQAIAMQKHSNRLAVPAFLDTVSNPHGGLADSPVLFYGFRQPQDSRHDGTQNLFASVENLRLRAAFMPQGCLGFCPTGASTRCAARPLEFLGIFRMFVTLATNFGNGISLFLPMSTMPSPSILRHLGLACRQTDGLHGNDVHYISYDNRRGGSRDVLRHAPHRRCNPAIRPRYGGRTPARA